MGRGEDRVSPNGEIAQKLQAAVSRHLGRATEIDELSRLTGGATKTTWRFDAIAGAERLPLILQLSEPVELAPDDPARRQPRLYGAGDAGIMMAAERAGVPAPHVRMVLEEADGLGTGFVTDRVEGEVLGRKIVSEPRFAEARRGMAAQCGKILARIHAIEPAAVPFVTCHSPADFVSSYRAVADYHGLRHPAVELCFRWAEAHLPQRARTTVVHGDFRNGNFIVDESGIRAVLDWEIGHLGDPMFDLGWVCVRTWRFGGAQPVGGFGEREELFRAYEEAGGGPVDPEHVFFWEAFGCLRWALICLQKGQAYRHGGGIEVEGLAIGRRMEEPLHDFLTLVFPKR